MKMYDVAPQSKYYSVNAQFNKYEWFVVQLILLTTELLIISILIHRLLLCFHIEENLENCKT